MLSMPKVYSYASNATPCCDRWTPWLPLKNCDGYTSIVASTPWWRLHSSVDQMHRSLITEDSPRTLWSKLKMLKCQVFVRRVCWFQRTPCHWGYAPPLADRQDTKKLWVQGEMLQIDVQSLCSARCSPEVRWILDNSDIFPEHCKASCQSWLGKSGGCD